MSAKHIGRLQVAMGLLGLVLCLQPAQAQKMVMRGGFGPGAAGPAGGIEGLHIPQGRQVNFNLNMTDGAGFNWDLQYYLNVGQGTNSIYSGGLYCQIGGSNMSSNGIGWQNAAGDEVEIGPMSRGSYQVYRRCKVYKDQGLARWLDIFVNTGPNPQNIPVRVTTSTNYSMSSMLASGGGNSFGAKDWAFITDYNDGGNNVPKLLHVVCDGRSKLRPNVQANSNSIFVTYNLVVPPGQTAIVCYFESQGRSVDELKKRMETLRLNKVLKDLPPAVQKLIVNMRPASDMERVDLERSAISDVVQLKNGDSIFGRITNQTFPIDAFYGHLDLPADKVIGFAAVEGQEDQTRAVLAGGQVITGMLKDAKLLLELPTGGTLDIPLARIRQCSYRLSKERPEDAPLTDPLIMLRTGDRVAFQADQLKCTFQTRHGLIELSGQDLVEVRLQHEERGVHRATFVNGSTLGGILGPDKLSLPLRLGPRLSIPRDMVLSIRFADETKDDAALARVVLSNDDELYGQLADESYGISSEFGAIAIKPANLLGITFDRQDPSRVAVRLWDTSVIRGELKQETVKFALKPGPVLNLHVGHIVSMDCPAALPPDEVVKRVEKLITDLSSANYKDRQEAQDQLLRMGGAVVPLLRKNAEHADPEVRQRVKTLLERLTGDGQPPMQPMSM